jgi:hypothetical protein
MVVMTVWLLRPEVPVFARCTDHRIQARMERFSRTAAIHPDDRFGDYLALSIHRPVNRQLLSWLMDNDQEELPPVRRGLADGRWVVCAEPEFGQDVVSDLTAAGPAVDLVDPADGEPDVSHAVGFVAGAHHDTTNIAMAEQVSGWPALTSTSWYGSGRTPKRPCSTPRSQIDSVYIATELVAREVLARVLTPMFWSFVDHAFSRSDGWATDVRDRLRERCGDHALNERPSSWPRSMPRPLRNGCPAVRR